MARGNWYLKVLRSGFELTHEANTSRYVHEVLCRCLAWPMEAIHPQKNKRGFIDYELVLKRPPASIYVEVKRLDASLHPNQIRPYLVSRGPMPDGLRVGALTNLRQWKIYVASTDIREMVGDQMIEVLDLSIGSRADVEHLDALIGYRPNGALRELRAALSDSKELIINLLVGDPDVLRAVREALDEIRDRHDLDARLPQYEHLTEYLSYVFAGEDLRDCPFPPAKFRQAIRSEVVAEAVNIRLMEMFDARSQVGPIRNTIREILKTAEGAV